MARHWFFFSYARDNEHRQLTKFFNDLWGMLSGPLDSIEKQEVPFRDTKSVPFGGRWDLRAQEALEWSRTMICMVSPAYLSSEWCGRELAFFREVSAHHYPGGDERVLPVIWSDVGLAEGRTLPAALQGGQYARNMPPEYEEVGLFGIMTDPRLRRYYRTFLSAIARDLVSQGKRYAAFGGAPRVTLANTLSAFQSSAAMRARVVYLSSSQGWRPFVPPELADPVQNIIARKQIGSEELAVGPGFAQSVAACAEAGHPVLIVLEPRSDRVAETIAPLLELNRTAHRTVALFVAWNDQDPEVQAHRQTWQDAIDSQINPRVALVNPPIRTPLQLQQEVRRTIDLIQAQITRQSLSDRTPEAGQFVQI